jgi:DNA-binding response OmpR family regulator
MIKLKISSQKPWLETLLSQYFNELEISNDADISILEDTSSFTINTSSLSQSWRLNKPISILSVINIIIQANKSREQDLIIIGPLNFYPAHRICIFQEEEITLTQKETEILLYLAKHPEAVDKATLLAAIWGYSSDITTHTLETHIYKLRNKFLGKYELISSNDDGYTLQST